MNTNPFQNDMRHGGVGVHYDSGRLIISNLFQERGGVLAVIKHAYRQSLFGDEELSEELLQVQQACWENTQKHFEVGFGIKTRRS